MTEKKEAENTPTLVWSKDEDGDPQVVLFGVPNVHCVAVGDTPELALHFLGDQIFGAFADACEECKDKRDLAHPLHRTCSTCVHLTPFELSPELNTCPVVNIRIHTESAAIFGCNQHEPKQVKAERKPIGGQNMEAVIIPAKTVVHISGIPVALAVDTLVETTPENMPLLTGYHYANLPGRPDALLQGTK